MFYTRFTARLKKETNWNKCKFFSLRPNFAGQTLELKATSHPTMALMKDELLFVLFYISNFCPSKSFPDGFFCVCVFLELHDDLKSKLSFSLLHLSSAPFSARFMFFPLPIIAFPSLWVDRSWVFSCYFLQRMVPSFHWLNKKPVWPPRPIRSHFSFPCFFLEVHVQVRSWPGQPPELFHL